MNNRNIIIVVIIFLLAVAGMFIYAYMKSSEIETREPEQTEDEQSAEGPYSYIERVDAKHFYIDGEHTLAGEIMMPTPCDLLTWDTRVAESFPEQVTVEFNVTNNADACAQVLTPQRFKVEFSASRDASIHAQLEGRNVELNLVPAEEGETPDDFELFIKG